MPTLKSLLRIVTCLKEQSLKEGDLSTYHTCANLLTRSKNSLYDCIKILDKKPLNKELRNEWHRCRQLLVVELGLREEKDA